MIGIRKLRPGKVAVCFATAVLVLGAVGATCNQATGPASSTTSTSTSEVALRDAPSPTLPFGYNYAFGGIAHDLQDAANFARDELGFRPPFLVAGPRSMEYVQSTYGQALTLFGLSRESDKLLAIADGVPVVIFVAHGEFQFMPSRFIEGATPETLTTAWIAVPIGERGDLVGADDKQYDLRKLGDVHELPLPLPELPTPVPLH